MSNLEKICLGIIFWGSVAVLFVPLMVFNSLYFPYIFSKALYFQTLVEILLLVYFWLAWKLPQYRPNFKSPLVFLPGLFVLVLLVTSYFGVDFERSFFSYQERMTGILLWMHFYIWLVIVVGCIKQRAQWMKLVKISLLISLWVGLRALAQKAGFSWAGSQTAVLTGTLGNTIFLGCYAGMHFFLAGLVFFYEKIKWQKYLAGVIGIFSLYIMFGAGSRGEMLGVGAGILVFLFLEALTIKNLKKRWILVGVGLLLVGSFIFLNTQRDSAWVKKLPYGIYRLSSAAKLDQSRILAWGSAWKGFKEKPWTGWGWENFDAPFDKYYDPALTRSGLGNTWYDKAHSQVFDLLALSGIFGLLSYLAFYGAYLWRAYGQKRRLTKILIDNNSPQTGTEIRAMHVLIAAIVAYFVQNLTAFDTPGVMVSFFFILGMTYHFSGQQAERKMASVPIVEPIQPVIAAKLSIKEMRRLERKLEKKQTSSVGVSLPPVLVIILSIGVICVLWWQINWQPCQASKRFIELWSRRVVEPEATVERFKVILVNNLFTRAEFKMKTVELVNERWSDKKLKADKFKELLQMGIEGMEDNIRESPYSTRYYIYLSQLYAMGADFYPEYIDNANQILLEAIELSHGRQEIYYNLAMNYLSRENLEEAEKYARQAFDLDPQVLDSKNILGLVLLVKGDFDDGIGLVGDTFYRDKPNLILPTANMYAEKDRFAEAYELTKRLTEINPKNVDALTLQTVAAFKIKQNAVGAELLTQLQELNPAQAEKIRVLLAGGQVGE